MNRRSVWHNYWAKGTYMLTLVVAERQPLFGSLHGDGFAETGTPEAARVELSALGLAVRDEEIKKIPAYYPMVEVWKLCVMPDHLHFILRVKEEMPVGKHLGQVVRGFKTGCSRAWWRLQDAGLAPCGKPQGTRATQGTRAAKGFGAAPVPGGFPPGSSMGSPSGSPFSAFSPLASRPVLFERGYCDKILMRDGQLDNWKRYLDDNPRRLAIKRQCPQFFTVMQQVNVAGQNCQMVGNRFLLDIPEKEAVIVHRAYTDHEYQQLCNHWLAVGEAGGVLVSAAIAPREKLVMREAMNRGYNIILLRENGFPKLYKPTGEAFNVCTQGRLLQISPWDYHMERRTISREECLQLNSMAEKIAY